MVRWRRKHSLLLAFGLTLEYTLVYLALIQHDPYRALEPTAPEEPGDEH